MTSSLKRRNVEHSSVHVFDDDQSASARFGGAIGADLNLEELATFFHLPIALAAKEIGVCATVLKKICRKNKVPRWPHRKIKSLNKSIEALERTLAHNPDQRTIVSSQISDLKAKRDMVMKYPETIVNGGAGIVSSSSVGANPKRKRARISSQRLQQSQQSLIAHIQATGKRAERASKRGSDQKKMSVSRSTTTPRSAPNSPECAHLHHEQYPDTSDWSTSSDAEGPDDTELASSPDTTADSDKVDSAQMEDQNGGEVPTANHRPIHPPTAVQVSMNLTAYHRHPMSSHGAMWPSQAPMRHHPNGEDHRLDFGLFMDHTAEVSHLLESDPAFGLALVRSRSGSLSGSFSGSASSPSTAASSATTSLANSAVPSPRSPQAHPARVSTAYPPHSIHSYPYAMPMQANYPPSMHGAPYAAFGPGLPAGTSGLVTHATSAYYATSMHPGAQDQFTSQWS